MCHEGPATLLRAFSPHSDGAITQGSGFAFSLGYEAAALWAAGAPISSGAKGLEPQPLRAEACVMKDPRPCCGPSARTQMGRLPRAPASPSPWATKLLPFGPLGLRSRPGRKV